MFQSKKRALFLFRRDGIEIYPDASGAALFFPFSPESVQNLEVLDPEKLSTEFFAFAQQNQFALMEVFFVLAEEVLFYKSFSIENKENTPENIKAFFDAVLFDPKETVKGSFTKDGFVTHYAGNKKLCTIIKKQLQLSTCEVEGIYAVLSLDTQPQPAAFGQAPSLSGDHVCSFYTQLPKLKTQNMLEKELPPATAQVLQTKVEVGDRKKLIPAIGFVVIAFLVLGYLVYSNLMQIQKKPTAVQPTPSPVASTPPVELPVVAPSTSSPSAAASSSSATSAKAAVRIRILNGSGIPGQAGIVRNKLTDLGYSQFETGNATVPVDVTVTQIVFKSGVSAEVRAEIEKAVKEIFPTALSSESAKVTDFDIVITTLK